MVGNPTNILDTFIAETILYCFYAIRVARILVELPTIEFGGIMGNNWGHVKDNHPQKPRKLLDIAKEILRRKHYSIRTEEAYMGWMVRYMYFHNKRHPKNMGVPEIEAFLTHLAVEGNVAASTRNQVFNAILFLSERSEYFVGRR